MNNLIFLTMSNNRTKPIHPSWDEVLPNFDSEFEVNGRFPHSQNSFLKWCKSFGVEIDAANFSTLKTKPLGQFTKVAILAWVAQRPAEISHEDWVGDGLGLDGSFNTGIKNKQP